MKKFLEPAPLVRNFRNETVKQRESKAKDLVLPIKSAVEYIQDFQKKVMVTPDEIWRCETEKELRELLSGLTMKKIRLAVELCGVHTTTRMRKAELINHSVREILKMKEATQMKQYALNKKLRWFEQELARKVKEAEFLSLQLQKMLLMGGTRSEVYQCMRAKSMKLTSELLRYRQDFEELRKAA